MASTVNTPFVRSAAVPEVPVKPSPAVDTEILAAIAPETLEDSYVYVHCYFENESEEMLIRIWRTTYLVDRDTGSRSSLVHAENISFAPMWTAIPRVGTYNFLLIFSALPKACTMFDLVEEVPQPGGFHVQDIARNQQDVYHVDI